MTDFDSTSYFGTVPCGDLAGLLVLEAARMRDLLASHDEWAREVEVIADEAEMLRNDPEHLWIEDLARILFAKSDPYHHGILGPVGELPDLAEARHFHRRHYTPLRCAVAVAGATEVEPLLCSLETGLGRLPMSGRAAAVRRPTLRKAPRTADLDAVDGSARVYFVWPAPPWGTPGSWALTMWGNLLVVGADAHLASVRVSGAPLSDYGYQILRWRRAPLLIVWGEADDEDVLRLEDALHRALLEAPSPSGTDIERARHLEAIGGARAVEDSCDRAGLKADALAYQLAEGDGVLLIERVTDEMVREAARVTRGPVSAVLRYHGR